MVSCAPWPFPGGRGRFKMEACFFYPRYPMSAAPLTFYSFPLSGHSHRVALMLSLLDVPHRTVDRKSVV